MTTLFNIGDVVIVGRGLPPGHVRTPMFLRGRKGKIIKYFGSFPNPERLAYGLSGLPKINLYQVLFAMGDTWDEGGDYASKDTVTADIYETWLEKT
jgi:nitrile hydratase|tara:strand:- start:2896 stop:3183 length:288 start_codon:yes stop_codon:yes gene_type:complete